MSRVGVKRSFVPDGAQEEERPVLRGATTTGAPGVTSVHRPLVRRRRRRFMDTSDRKGGDVKVSDFRGGEIGFYSIVSFLRGVSMFPLSTEASRPFSRVM